MHLARVVAPPRVLVVETPAADAVDLGCAYALEVEADGSTRLSVTSGQVALEAGEGKRLSGSDWSLWLFLGE